MATDINDLNEGLHATKRREVSDCCSTANLGDGTKIGFRGRPDAHLGATEKDYWEDSDRDCFGFLLPQHYREM